MQTINKIEKELSIRESFILVYNITQLDAELECKILRKLNRSFNECPCKEAPKMSTFKIEVKDMFDAIGLIDQIKLSQAMIEDINHTWEMGWLTPSEKAEQLSKYISYKTI